MKVGFRYDIIYERLTPSGWYNNIYVLDRLYVGKSYIKGRVFFVFKESMSSDIRNTWYIPVDRIQIAKVVSRKPYFRVGDNISFKLKNGKCYTGPVLFVAKESGEWFLKIPTCLTKLDNIEKFIVL